MEDKRLDERLLTALGELLRAGARQLGFDLVDVEVTLIRGETPDAEIDKR